MLPNKKQPERDERKKKNGNKKRMETYWKRRKRNKII